MLCSCFLRSTKVRTSQFSLVRTSQCLFYLAPYKCIRNCPFPKGKSYERQQKRARRGTQARKVKSFVQGHLSQRQMEKYKADCQHPDSVFPFCPENEARNQKKPYCYFESFMQNFAVKVVISDIFLACYDFFGLPLFILLW